MKHFKLYAYREETDFIQFIAKFESVEKATLFIYKNEPDSHEGCELILNNNKEDITSIYFDCWEKLGSEVKTQFKKLLSKTYRGS